MSVIAFIVIAISFGISTMLVFQRCAAAQPIRLSAGLAATIATAATHIALFAVGILVGNLLQIESPETPGLFAKQNAYIALGLFLAVIIKMLIPYLRHNPQLPVFNIGNWSGILALAVATGINLLLAGIGGGFVTSPTGHWHRIVWPLLVSTVLLGYWGIMLGRQKVKLRPRIWMIIASTLLLGVAIAAVVNA